MTNPIDELKAMTLKDMVEVDDGDAGYEMMKNLHETQRQYDLITSKDTAVVQYELMNKLFSTLNIIKGFEVGMNGPREGKLFISFDGIEFVAEINPLRVHEAKEELYNKLKEV